MLRTCAALLAVLVFKHVCSQTVYQETPIIFDTSNIANGAYNFNFKTPGEIERSESGSLDSNGDYVVTGFYSYINDKNQRVAYEYVADKGGYRAKPKHVYDVSSPGNFEAPPPPQVIASLLG